MVVYLGALWNRFAMDDLYIIADNPLVRSPAGIWRAFAAPYWPPAFGGEMYRPVVTASFAIDRLLGGPAWFHFVNLCWHAGVSVAVAALVRHWAGMTAALVAGLLFAVHPVHVEAVANVVGRAELMAAGFSLLAVYAAVERHSVTWSAAALLLALLSKENAAVTPALIAWAWLLGVGRPPRAIQLAFAASWVVLAAGYTFVRWLVLHPYASWQAIAPVFQGASPSAVVLTAVAALTDTARLLLFPETLRADYSPQERTLVASLGDTRFLLGLAVFLAWAGLLAGAWRRGRRVETLGLGWIAIAYLPVANLLFPTGVLVAERTLYLPSVGVVVAFAAWTQSWSSTTRVLRFVVPALVLLGAIRTAARVPVWRDDIALTESILEDSPNSYRGPARTGGLLLSAGQTEKALAAFRTAAAIFDRDPTVFVGAADAAYTLDRAAAADTMLRRADTLCRGCTGYLRTQARAARSRGDQRTADWLESRAQALERP